jgi:hypothetical protein
MVNERRTEVPQTAPGAGWQAPEQLVQRYPAANVPNVHRCTRPGRCQFGLFE